ncbi:hypothetical protein TREES_T100017641 [Tupaia chinensis]|uniref:Uncharacterized protein n=1 Tax=Tupaia chinensis TaxID=246437 RepID=L9L4U8_TUPCH|nr:hypothetical protein TREES_T100017641 [Tupaia chinensis]
MVEHRSRITVSGDVGVASHENLVVLETRSCRSRGDDPNCERILQELRQLLSLRALARGLAAPCCGLSHTLYPTVPPACAPTPSYGQIPRQNRGVALSPPATCLGSTLGNPPLLLQSLTCDEVMKTSSERAPCGQLCRVGE